MAVPQQQIQQQNGPGPAQNFFSDASEMRDLMQQWPGWYDNPDPVTLAYQPTAGECMLAMPNARSCSESALRLAIAVVYRKNIPLMTQALGALRVSEMKRRLERLPPMDMAKKNLRMKDFPIHSLEVIWPQRRVLNVPARGPGLVGRLWYTCRVVTEVMTCAMVNIASVLGFVTGNAAAIASILCSCTCRGWLPLTFFPRVAFAGAGYFLLRNTYRHFLPRIRRYQNNVPPLVYVPRQAIAVPGPLQAPELIYHLVHGRERPDGWSMIFIPSDPNHNFLAAHWTFGTVIPETQQRMLNEHPVLIYTAAPIVHDPGNVVYWRCRPDAVNEVEYVDMHARGMACNCCWRIPCIHELQFLRRYPTARKVTLMSKYMIDGVGVGEIESSIDPEYKIHFGPAHATEIVGPRGMTRVMRSTHTMGPRVDLGYFLMLFENTSGLLFDNLARVMYMMPNPITALYCRFKWHMVPDTIETFDVRPLRIRSRLYRPRNRWRWFAVKACMSAMTAAALVYFVKRSTQRLPTLWTEMEQMERRMLEAAAAEAVQGVRAVVRETVGKATEVVTTSVDRMSAYFTSRLDRLLSRILREPPPPPKTSLELLRESVQKFVASIKEIEMKVPPKTMTQVARDNFHNSVFKMISTIYQIGYSLYFSYVAMIVSLQNVQTAAVYLLRFHDLKPIYHMEPRTQFAELRNTGLNLPCEDEFMSRLALMPATTRANVTDLIRRLCNEHRWPCRLNHQGFLLFLERTVTEEGATWVLDDLPPNTCVNCLCRRKIYRGLCKECKRSMRLYRPERLIFSDMMTTYIGRRGLWSVEFKLPKFTFKKSTKIQDRKDITISFGGEEANESDMLDWLDCQEVVTSLRGWNAGPTFCGYAPVCFPRGEATAIAAFCVRLGSEPTYTSEPEIFDLMYNYVVHDSWISPIEEESRDEFLKHFSGEKLIKMEEAYAEIDAGWSPKVEQDIEGNNYLKVKMKGFTKAEKGKNLEYEMLSHYKEKPTLKPRFICCPDPIVLAKLGPYTHSQTKWLSRKFTRDDHLFYAGCATPDDMNYWLNLTLRECPDMFSYVDDITAMDSSHSENSMKFHKRIRALQFRGIPIEIECMYDGEELLSIRVGRFKLSVNYVNASGVSDTSYKNSMLCLIIRLLAVANAVRDLSSFDTDEELYEFIDEVKNSIWISASGDDGLVRLPRFLMGTDMSSADARARYLQVWQRTGFEVKLAFVPENRWRMATYLAMRPTWNGVQYVWTPEPARRLRSLYWMIDCSLHPTAWARGISTSLLACASCNPLLKPLADWHLSVTHGPVIDVGIFSNPFSVFHRYDCKGVVTERAIEEFLIDYRLTMEDYNVFLDTLTRTRTPLVDFRCHFLDRVYQEES